MRSDLRELLHATHMELIYPLGARRIITFELYVAMDDEHLAQVRAVPVSRCEMIRRVHLRARDT